MRNLIRPAIVVFGALTMLTGVLYPALITASANLFWPHESTGSLVVENGRVLGSSLIGQPFDDAKYFWSRPSATVGQPYNGAASSGSNLGPSNPALTTAVGERVTDVQQHPHESGVRVPADLVTASASGLDPHVSPAAAAYQVPRVARARGLSEARVRALVRAHIEDRTFGFLGEPRVNVLALNFALDRASLLPISAQP